MRRARELAFPTAANGGNGMAVQTPVTARAVFEGVCTPPAVDRVGAQRAITDLLVALGVDSSSEHLGETPRRVADAYADFLTPEPFDVASFPNDQGYDELIIARAIPVRSLCEHHLLPFTGWAHVGYLPGRRILGLSSSPESWSCSPVACRFKNASPARWPTGSKTTPSPRGSV